MLSFNQKDLLEALIGFLGGFEKLTDLLSCDKVVTVSSVAPMLKHIAGLCKTEDENDGAKEVINQLKTGIWNYVSKR